MAGVQALADRVVFFEFRSPVCGHLVSCIHSRYARRDQRHELIPHLNLNVRVFAECQRKRPLPRKASNPDPSDDARHSIWLSADQVIEKRANGEREELPEDLVGLPMIE